MVSVIIPAYQEPYLNQTLESVLTNAVGEIEALPVLDGWKPNVDLPRDLRIRPVFIPTNVGKRGAINAALETSRGKYVMLLDAHCLVAPGYDHELVMDFQDNWLVIPRRYAVDIVNWQRDEKRPIVDYHYISYPQESSWGFGMYARPWRQQRQHRLAPQYDIDEVMTIQASCWFANREYFLNHVYPLDTTNYGPLAQDQQEIALKYWLGGGEVKVNKLTWYAHLGKRWYHYSKGVFSRLHKKDQRYIDGNAWGTWHWLNNEQPGMIHAFSWLIEKFWPVPGWPENWEEELTKLR